MQKAVWNHKDMARVVSTPEMHKALEAILGPSYVIYPHRHMHTCSPMAGQEWHQDPSIFPVRSIRPRAVLAMYYPGDVDLQDGPTGFLPGSHYMGLDASPDVEFNAGTQDLIEGQHQKMILCHQGRYDGKAFEQEVNESAVAFDNSNASPCLSPQPSYGMLKRWQLCNQSLRNHSQGLDEITGRQVSPDVQIPYPPVCDSSAASRPLRDAAPSRDAC